MRHCAQHCRGNNASKSIIPVFKGLTVSWEPRTLVRSSLTMAATGAQQVSSRRNGLTPCGSKQASPLRTFFAFELMVRDLFHLGCGHSPWVPLQPTSKALGLLYITIIITVHTYAGSSSKCFMEITVVLDPHNYCYEAHLGDENLRASR